MQWQCKNAPRVCVHEARPAMSSFVDTESRAGLRQGRYRKFHRRGGGRHAGEGVAQRPATSPQSNLRITESLGQYG